MSALTKGVFIVAAKRTPFGTYGGKFVQKSAADLQEVATKAALAAGGVKPEAVDSVVFGNVLSCTSADQNFMSRHVLLRCGIPIDKPALTVNRLCGSGFQAVVNGAQNIVLGDSSIVVTGGVDNMSQSPHIVRNIRFGVGLGSPLQLEDTLWVGLTDSYCKMPMAITAENLAEKYKLTKQEVNEFALRSQLLWKKANDEGRFKAELAPVTVKVKKQDVEVNVDEHPRPQTTLEGLNKLPTLFKKDGTVTAGNASGICDGAATVILANEDAIKKHNLTPLARLVAYSYVGVEPSIMGIGPVPAIQNVLKVANKTLNDVDLVEINEAFASQTLACAKELKLDINKLNLSGGAIALGHPLGASGARITAHLTHELRRQKAKLAIGSACIGGGQGIALLLESV